MDEQTQSILDPQRLDSILKEAELELLKITPEIDYLEECIKKIYALKERQHKLNSLIISIKSIQGGLDTKLYTDINNTQQHNVIENNNTLNKIGVTLNNQRKIFIPEVALNDVKKYLRVKNNLNYEIYKAVVFNTGSATTEQIKEYLIKNKIKQPKTKKGFENTELKEISSRANYLVRKNLLISLTPGVFSTVYGWSEGE